MKKLIKKLDFKDSKYYCKSCNSYFDKFIEIRDDSKEFVDICPYCYSDKIISKYKYEFNSQVYEKNQSNYDASDIDAKLNSIYIQKLRNFKKESKSLRIDTFCLIMLFLIVFNMINLLINIIPIFECLSFSMIFGTLLAFIIPIRGVD